MDKELLMRLLLTLTLAVISLVVFLLPESAVQIGLSLLPVLNFCILSSFVTGPAGVSFIGLAAPALAWLLLGDRGYCPWYLAISLSALAGGMTAVVYRRAFGTVLMSCIAGLLMSRITLALTLFISGIVLRDSYSLKEFLSEGFVQVWPGLLAGCLAVPLIVLLLKRTGFRYLLTRNARS